MGTVWVPRKPLLTERVDWDTWALPRPIGEWWFNEGGGGRIYDASGYGISGILTNMDPATDWVASDRGLALDFDGSNDRVVLSRGVINGRNAFSIWGRCLLSALPGVGIHACLYDEYTGAAAQEYLTYRGGAGFQFGIDTWTAQCTWAATAPVSTVYSLCGTYGAAQMALYYNGAQKTTATGPETAAAHVATYRDIGAWVVDSFLHGKIDALVMFGDRLTAGQVAALEGPVPIWQPQRYWYTAGGTTYYATLTETVGAADTQLHDTARLLSETVTTSDVLLKSIGRLLSETVTTTDVLQRSVARTLAETVTATDGLTRDVARSLAETITGSDAAITFDLSRTLTDTVSLADALTRLLSRALAETITAADDLEAHIAEVTVYYKTLTEIITATDSITRQKALILAVTLARKILDALLTRDALDAEFSRDILDLWGGNN